MNKNSINEVAKTYQRLVEAAPPPRPLEAPDADEAPDSPSYQSGGWNDLTGIPWSYYQGIEGIINDLYQTLTDIDETMFQCYESGTCTPEYVNYLERTQAAIFARIQAIEQMMRNMQERPRA